MVIESLKITDLLSIVLIILSIIPIFFSVSEKIFKIKIFQKIKVEILKFYLLGIEHKFLIGVVIFAIISFGLFSYTIYSYYSPSQTVDMHVYYPIDFIGISRGEVFDVIYNNQSILININQNFVWAKGWNENTRLKKIKLYYLTPGTDISINLLDSNNIYTVSGNSVLTIEDFSLNYVKNINYGMSIQNVGNNPFYLFKIETEEETIQPRNQLLVPFMLGIYSLFPLTFFYKKYKNKRVIFKPFDLLKKDAKYADRIQDIEMELKNNQDLLKYLEILNHKNELSQNYYINKKEYLNDNLKELNEEMNEIKSEIEEINKRISHT
ncbi:MAG: hypothetical protein KAT05_10375 [Spirochaetes bacterium]|nr:hypothetical protein [Spirochaetota bacterium]